MQGGGDSFHQISKVTTFDTGLYIRILKNKNISIPSVLQQTDG